MKHLILYFRLILRRFDLLNFAALILIAFLLSCQPKPEYCQPTWRKIYTGPTVPSDLFCSFGEVCSPPEIYKLSTGFFNGISDSTAYKIYYFLPITSSVGLTVKISGEKGHERELLIADFPPNPTSKHANAFTSATVLPYSFKTTSFTSQQRNSENTASITVPLDYYAAPREFSMSGTGEVKFEFTAIWAAGTTTVVEPCAE